MSEKEIKHKGKAPAYQFYPNDWTRDLEEHSLKIEGAWIRINCKLWWSTPRGQLTRTLEQWARILRVQIEEALVIIRYLQDSKIGDVTTDPGVTLPVTFPLHFPEDNVLVTIKSRRMWRDDKNRTDNALRQERFRMKRGSNGPLTDLSQRSSSSSSSSSSCRLKKDDTLKRAVGVSIFDENSRSQEEEKYPLLKQVRTVPALRGVSLDIWLKCKQRRNKFMDWEKAVRFVCDKAELQTEIKNPGAFVDSYLSYYEKDHLANCQSREAKAKARNKDLEAFLEYCREFKDDPKRIQEITTDMVKQYGQGFLIEAQDIQNKGWHTTGGKKI